MRIDVPKKLDIPGALRFTENMLGIELADDFDLNFAALDFCDPFGALVFICVLMDFQERAISKGMLPRVLIKNDNGPTCGYLRRMGFFNALSRSLSPSDLVNDESNRFIPITIMNFDKIVSEANDNYKDPREVIEKRCEIMADVLTRKTKGDIHDSLVYSLREILRNSFEHGEVKNVYYHAQFFPSRNRVELSIMDRGIGIKNSLSKNPRFSIQDDASALDLAIKPGISSVTNNRTYSDHWANSGYGLYMIKSLCELGGEFCLASGFSAISLIGSKKEIYSCYVPGVAAKITLSTDKLTSLSSMLASFRKGVDPSSLNAPTPASKSSIMLTRDF